MNITAVETNAGTINVSNGKTAWGLGLHNNDATERAEFVEAMRAWAAGEWEPNESDGQVRIPLAEFNRSLDICDFREIDPTTGQ